MCLLFHDLYNAFCFAPIEWHLYQQQSQIYPVVSQIRVEPSSLLCKPPNLPDSKKRALFRESYLESITGVVQNFIKILFKDTSKMPRSGHHFVKKGTLLRYLLSITEWIVSSVANQRTTFLDRTLVDLY